MSEVSRSSNVEPMVFNVDKILDAHTHLTGQESPEQILECMNACGVEKAFLFAPELDVETRRLTNDNMEDVRKHNDYCADDCSAAPEGGIRVHRDAQRPPGTLARVEVSADTRA
jgi:hypothetical protein